MTTIRPPLFAAPATSLRSREDGSILLWSQTPLAPYAASVAQLFRGAAAADPERVLAAQRDGDGWRTVSYGQARAAADAIGQSLLDRKLGQRPLMILSGNSIQHLLLTLGAHTVGVPVARSASPTRCRAATTPRSGRSWSWPTRAWFTPTTATPTPPPWRPPATASW